MDRKDHCWYLKQVNSQTQKVHRDIRTMGVSVIVKKIV